MTDLALRSGFATSKDYSCTQGLNNIVNHYSKGETLATLEYLFQRQSDFDADKVQPHYDFENYNKTEEREEFEIGTPYNPAKDPTSFDDYYRRLEDICSDYFEDYMSNLVFTIYQRSGSHGVITYNANHYLQPTLLSVEDESVTELADLQLRTDVNDYSLSVKANAKDNLPYVLKRLHNLSRYCGIHMLSMIASYVAAKEENALRRQAGSTMTLKKNAVIAKNVYKCDNYGNVKERVTVSNKSKRASDMFDWLEGTNNMYQSYREDYLNFLQYCKILNIDLVNDDMTKYDVNFIDNLTVITLTPDTQYNQEVFNAIRDSNLMQAEQQTEDIYLETIACFRDKCETNEDLMKIINTFDSIKSANNMALGRKLHAYYCLMLAPVKFMPESSKYSWQEGFLYYDDELVVLDTALISRESFIVPKFIISELGFCIHINNDLYLEMMTINIASDNMQNRYVKPDPDYEEDEWKWFQ